MIPGISARPPASSVSFAGAETLPTSRMRPSLTATSPCTGREPLPSRRSAPRITRSCTASVYLRLFVPHGARVKLFEIPGKCAFIAGAGRGIGAATAELFASAGAAVAVLDKYENYAPRTADTIRRSGGQAISVTCDFYN